MNEFLFLQGVVSGFDCRSIFDVLPIDKLQCSNAMSPRHRRTSRKPPPSPTTAAATACLSKPSCERRRFMTGIHEFCRASILHFSSLSSYFEVANSVIIARRLPALTVLVIACSGVGKVSKTVGAKDYIRGVWCITIKT